MIYLISFLCTFLIKCIEDICYMLFFFVILLANEVIENIEASHEDFREVIGIVNGNKSSDK